MKNIFLRRFIFSVAAFCVCVPAAAESEQSMAAIGVLSRVEREADFLSLQATHGKVLTDPTYNPLDPSAVVARTVTPGGSKVVYTCGVMLDQNNRVQHIPDLDSVTMSKESPSGGVLSLTIIAIPYDSVVSSKQRLPGHVVTVMSDGKAEYFELTKVRIEERPIAQACLKHPAGGEKSCQSIEPYFVGGTTIRQAWGVVTTCQNFLDSHKISGMPLINMGSQKAANIMAQRLQDHVFKFPYLPAAHP
ncbi:MAG: hypothetical protein ABTQ34_07835 [Bdellovibrionales bacterium]